MTEAPAGPRVGQGRRPAVRRPWPRLPRWFWAGSAVAVVAFGAFVALAVRYMNEVREQPLLERRSPPRAGAMSHDVVEVALPDAPLRDVPCGVVNGLRVQGGEQAGAVLAEAVTGMCERLNGVDPALADRVVAAARQHTIVVFGRFTRTGEYSTTLPGAPPRIVLSDVMLRQYKGYLMAVLAHEFWHAGSVGVTAEDEYAARRAEAAMCRYVEAAEQFRGCIDARAVAALPESEAVAGLRAGGFR